jgi:dihydrofolate reductase
MSVSIIAAVGRNLELGRDNDLIWHFKEDMKFFKETTLGSTVIMGRKTFESLPKALPGRRNIVITSNPDYTADGAETVCGVSEALEAAGEGEVFIIGGGIIYRLFLPFADKLYLTEIDADCPDADTYFPEFDSSLYNAEKLSDYNVDGVHFSHICYTKK